MTRKERWLSSCALLAAILPFVLVASTLQLLPSTVEMTDLLGPTYSVNISKYSFLYVGLFCLIPIALIITARILKAKKVVERNFIAMVLSGLVLGLLFLFVGAYSIVYTVVVHELDLLKDIDFFGMAAVILCLVMAMLSNFLPDLKRNEILGIKNRYTAASERVWNKVHSDAADVFGAGFFFAALLISGFSIWLKYRYGWIHLGIWFLVTLGLFVWAYLHSRTISERFETAAEPVAVAEQA